MGEREKEERERKRKRERERERGRGGGRERGYGIVRKDGADSGLIEGCGRERRENDFPTGREDWVSRRGGRDVRVALTP
jgi:hypothetical protein